MKYRSLFRYLDLKTDLQTSLIHSFDFKEDGWSIAMTCGSDHDPAYLTTPPRCHTVPLPIWCSHVWWDQLRPRPARRLLLSGHVPVQTATASFKVHWAAVRWRRSSSLMTWHFNFRKHSSKWSDDDDDKNIYNTVKNLPADWTQCWWPLEQPGWPHNLHREETALTDWRLCRRRRHGQKTPGDEHEGRW